MIAKLIRFFGIPLVNAELHRQARRRRVHLFRWLYLFLICFIFGAFWCDIELQRQSGFRMGTRQMVVQLFATITWIQFLLLALAGAQSSANMIAEERSRDTLTVMLSTPLSATGLLSGKLLSIFIRSLLYILALLPMFGLLMMEGGLSPTQIVATSILTLFQVAICSSIGIFGAIVNKKANAGVGLTALYLMGAPILLGGLENLSTLASSYPWLSSLPTLSEETWLKLNIFKAFSHSSTGMGVMFSGGDAITEVTLMLLGQAVTTLLLAGSFFFLASVFLRPVSQLGKMSIWQAAWRSIFGTKKGAAESERHSWELDEPRPWFSQAYAWRNLGFAATPGSRRMRLIISFVLPLIFVIAPIIFYCGEFALRYSCYAVEEVIAGKGIPPLPEHPVYNGGSYGRSGVSTVFINKKRTKKLGRIITSSPWRGTRDSKKFLHIWFNLWVCVLTVIIFLLFTFGLAMSAAKEVETRRFSLLLATPLTSQQIAFGLIAKALGSWSGVFLVLPLLVIGGLFTGQLAIAPTIMLSALTVIYLLFYGSIGLRFGLLSRSVRVAQSKLAGLIFGFGIGWPILFWMFAGILSMLMSFRGPDDGGMLIMFFLLCFSPILLPIFAGVGAYNIFHNNYGNSEEQMMFWASLVHMVVLLIAGRIIFGRVTRSVRQYAQRTDAKKR